MYESLMDIKLLLPDILSLKGCPLFQWAETSQADATIIDGENATLIPGLIDAHVHTSIGGLRDALKFGVTTELEMNGDFTKRGREIQLKNVDDIADVRSAGTAITAPGGHPDELLPDGDEIPEFVLKELEKLSEEDREAMLAAYAHDHDEIPQVTTVEEAIKHVHTQVENGSDYIKIMIEEGTVMGAPGLPVLSDEILKTAVTEAHKFDKLVIAHVDGSFIESSHRFWSRRFRPLVYRQTRVHVRIGQIHS